MAINQSAGRLTFLFAEPVIVVVKGAENTEQAWRRHIKKHPEDTHADIKIFHFLSPNTFQNLLIA